MCKKEEVFQVIIEQKLLPLFYYEDVEVCVEVLKALYAAGIRTLEYTNRGENALTNFKILRQVVDKTMPGLLLGAGTIRSKEAALNFIEAGADFVVCPTMNIAVAEIVQGKGLLWVPGCLTPTEVNAAEDAGASLVKIFPGNILGPSFISSIKEIFPRLYFMATGGVEIEESNLKTWFVSGVVAVGIGSKLITKKALETKDYEGIRKSTIQSLKLIKEV